MYVKYILAHYVRVNDEYIFALYEYVSEERLKGSNLL